MSPRGSRSGPRARSDKILVAKYFWPLCWTCSLLGLSWHSEKVFFKCKLVTVISFYPSALENIKMTAKRWRYTHPESFFIEVYWVQWSLTMFPICKNGVGVLSFPAPSLQNKIQNYMNWVKSILGQRMNREKNAKMQRLNKCTFSKNNVDIFKNQFRWGFLLQTSIMHKNWQGFGVKPQLTLITQIGRLIALILHLFTPSCV